MQISFHLSSLFFFCSLKLSIWLVFLSTCPGFVTYASCFGEKAFANNININIKMSGIIINKNYNYCVVYNSEPVIFSCQCPLTDMDVWCSRWCREGFVGSHWKLPRYPSVDHVGLKWIWQNPSSLLALQAPVITNNKSTLLHCYPQHCWVCAHCKKSYFNQFLLLFSSWSIEISLKTETFLRSKIA